MEKEWTDTQFHNHLLLFTWKLQPQHFTGWATYL